MGGGQVESSTCRGGTQQSVLVLFTSQRRRKSLNGDARGITNRSPAPSWRKGPGPLPQTPAVSNEAPSP